MKTVAIAYSPRGFTNESRVVVVPADKVAETKSQINNNPNAYVFTGNKARQIKAQWKRDVMEGAEIETEVSFY